MVSFALSPAEEELQDRARAFAQQHIRPVAKEREWIPDPSERLPWDIIEKASHEGFRTLTVPPEYGGPGEPTTYIGEALVLEEFAAADPGIAVIFNHAFKDCRYIAHWGTAAQREWFFREYVADHRYLTAISGTEPEHGSDWVFPHEDFRFETTAVLEGDEWVLNGRKHCISNGADAKMIICYACTDPAKPYREGTSCFLVPRSAPGLKAGRVHDKIGLRLVNNAEVIYDDCLIPRDNLLGELNGFIRQRINYAGEGNLVSAAIKTGIARSAYEEALEHAKRRVQGGKPIIEHQLVGAKLAEMATLVEQMRNITWKLGATIDQPDYDRREAARLGSMSVWFNVEAGMRVCLLAFQVCGCSAAWRDSELWAEKHVRDMLPYFPNDGTHSIHLLRLQRQLMGEDLPRVN